MLEVANTSKDELGPFVRSLASCPKTGLHNPFKHVGRYVMLGDVTFRAAAELRKPEVQEFFVRLIQVTSAATQPCQSAWWGH